MKRATYLGLYCLFFSHAAEPNSSRCRQSRLPAGMTRSLEWRVLHSHTRSTCLPTPCPLCGRHVRLNGGDRSTNEETGESSRVTAVRSTESLLEESDFVKVGIVKFSANAKSETVELDDNQIPKTYFAGYPASRRWLLRRRRGFNFLVALDEAYSEIRTEMLRMDEGQLGRKFVVIFLSDGLPDRGGGGARNQAGSILESIRRMHDLKSVFSIKEIQFHTAYLSSDAGAFAAEDAQNLLSVWLTLAEAPSEALQVANASIFCTSI